MAVYTTHNISTPDLPSGITAAADNPLEHGRLYRHYDIGGVTMTDPEWALGPLADLLPSMVRVADYGTKYDYQPERFSYALYGTHELWLLLMQINHVNTRALFRGPMLRYVSVDWAGRLLELYRFAHTRVERADAAGVPTITDLTVRTVYT